MNIFCVGRNYAQHAAELGNAIPAEPLLFMKPTHALHQLTAMDESVALPGDQGELHYELEIVIQISQSYREGAAADELIGRFALGIDFTLRDVQTTIKSKGHPWLKAKGFLRSALISPWQDFRSEADLRELPFALQHNGQSVQQGKAAEMIFSLQQIIDFCGDHYGLAQGDMIFTGTPAGVGKVSHGDRLAMLLNGNELASCVVQLRGRQEKTD